MKGVKRSGIQVEDFKWRSVSVITSTSAYLMIPVCGKEVFGWSLVDSSNSGFGWVVIVENGVWRCKGGDRVWM